MPPSRMRASKPAHEESLKRPLEYKLIYAMKRLLALFALTSGCSSALDEPEVVFSKEECPDGGCGLNAAFVHGAYFGELNFAGIENSQGFSLTGYFNLPPTGVKLDVVDNRLVALDGGGLVVAQGAALVNSGFMLEREGKQYPVTVVEVHRRTMYWAKPQPVESYRFKYLQVEDATTAMVDVCPAEVGVDNTLRHDAVVFEHERYIEETKQIDTSDLANWFNVACLAGGAGKTFMMRFAIASSNPPTITTTVQERQAMINAWTANYCGDGRSFTTTGHPLRMRDSKQWIPKTPAWSWTTPATLKSYEAIFNETGAVCLDTPRLATGNADDDKAARAEIDDHCLAHGRPAIPRCTDVAPAPGLEPAAWQTQGYILTANPL